MAGRKTYDVPSSVFCFGMATYGGFGGTKEHHPNIYAGRDECNPWSPARGNVDLASQESRYKPGELELEHRIWVKHLIHRMLKFAANQGVMMFDTAGLYRINPLFGAVMDDMLIPIADRKIYGKGFRCLVPSHDGDVENQPEGFLGGCPSPTHMMTDKYGVSALLTRKSVGDHIRELGVEHMAGMGLHDFNDWRIQRPEYRASTFNWDTSIPWRMVETEVLNPLKDLNTPRSEDGHVFVKTLGMCEKNGGHEAVMQFLDRYPLWLDYVMATYCNPLFSTKAYELLERLREMKKTAALAGVYSGGAFVMDTNPIYHKRRKSANRVIIDYERATDDLLDQLAALFRVCKKHDTTLQQLACEFATKLYLHYPDVITRITIAAPEFEQLKDTMKRMRTREITEDCWKELLGEGPGNDTLIDVRLRDALLGN